MPLRDRVFSHGAAYSRGRYPFEAERYRLGSYSPLVTTIGVVSIDLRGHLGPCLRLAGTLVELGHRVLVWAPESSGEGVRASGAELVAHEPEPTSRSWSDMAEFAVRLAAATAQSLPVMLQQLLETNVDLIIADVHTPWAKMAAEYLGLPLVVSNPLFPAWARARQRNSRPAQPRPRRPRRPLRTPAYGSLRRELRAQWGIDIGRPAQAITIDAAATISYTAPVVIGEEPAPPGWCLAGPLMRAQPRERGSGRPLIYGALGTFSNRWLGRFEAIIQAVADLDCDAVISTGGRFGSDDFPSLPPNVTVANWVDAPAVLGRAAVHVTHAGGSSVHESLIAGVPMVCLPVGSDQPQWTRRVVACGVGERSGYEPAQIRSAIERQLSPDGGRQAAEHLARRLADYPGATLVGRLIEDVLNGAVPSVA